MTSTPRPIRGTQDMIGEPARRFGRVVEAFDRVRRLYGFGRAEMPVFENTAVFARSLGETTDVVSKEMYSFEDRGGESLTLRPEFTAGLCRAFLTEGWQQHAPLKLATHGPVFRYERPQKGRFRQFHQLDAEVIGAAEPLADVELLAMADQLLRELGIADGVVLKLNTLGDRATRDAWREALVRHFGRHLGELSEDSVARLAKNPLRILDSKDAKDRPIAEAAPGIDEFMSAEAGAFFEQVTKGLDAAGVPWTRDDRLVRGLDYYRHTAFEFVTDRLGAQGTVLAGGRYDGLMESLGGKATPAVGWAAGIERLAMMLDEPAGEAVDVVAFAANDFGRDATIAVGAELRRAGISTETITGGSDRKRSERAEAKRPKIIIQVFGDHSGEEPDIFFVNFWKVRGASASFETARSLVELTLGRAFAQEGHAAPDHAAAPMLKMRRSVSE